MHQTPDPCRAILLTFGVFCLQPFALGAWLAMIPFIKASLGLSKAELALTFLAMPLALIPTLQIASRVIARFGRAEFAILLPVHGLAACGPFLATGQGTLFVALAVFGAMGAFMQVCLNVYAGRLEKQLDRMVMRRCHGFCALGLAMGSALAGLLAGSNPIWRFSGLW